VSGLEAAELGARRCRARCSILAGIPPSTTARSVNRQCSSGLQAIISGAHERLRLHGAATTR